jgi:hypothetical protein
MRGALCLGRREHVWWAGTACPAHVVRRRGIAPQMRTTQGVPGTPPLAEFGRRPDGAPARLPLTTAVPTKRDGCGSNGAPRSGTVGSSV